MHGEMMKCKICLDIWIAEKRREDVEFTSAPTKLFFIICLHDFNGDLYTIRLPGQAVTILTCAVEKHLKQGLNLTQWPSLEKIHDCPFIPKLAAPFWVGKKYNIYIIKHWLLYLELIYFLLPALLLIKTYCLARSTLPAAPCPNTSRTSYSLGSCTRRWEVLKLCRFGQDMNGTAPNSLHDVELEHDLSKASLP